MLNAFADDVRALTNGEVSIEVLPAGAVVGVRETLDAVDKGLVEGGFAWTHYWSGKHPAAMLFGSPVAGAGVGIDNIAFLSWFLYAAARTSTIGCGTKWASTSRASCCNRSGPKRSAGSASRSTR